MHVRWSFRKQKNLSQIISVASWRKHCHSEMAPSNPSERYHPWGSLTPAVGLNQKSSSPWRNRSNIPKLKIWAKKLLQNWVFVMFDFPAIPRGPIFQKKKNTCSVVGFFCCFFYRNSNHRNSREIFVEQCWMGQAGRGRAIFTSWNLHDQMAQKCPQFPLKNHLW